MLWIDTLAVEVIEAESRKRRFLETGGALFGYETEDQLVIALATQPGSKATHRRCSFRPDSQRTAWLMQAVHRLSDGRYRYLGSWHSHPLGRAIASEVDAQTASEMAAQRDVRLLRPVLFVQQLRLSKASLRTGELRAYRWSRARGTLEAEELKVTELQHRLVDPEDLGEPSSHL